MGLSTQRSAQLSAQLSAPPNEELIEFAVGDALLIGMLSRPAGAPRELGVLIVVGGPQYRVGAHRQFVHLARQLAGAGYTALRFDHRGVGDALAPAQPFDALDDDIAAATDALLSAEPRLRGVLIWGLCDAASAALLYVRRRQDPRVQALALLNPWVRSAQGQARTQMRHYYVERLRDPAFWRKLLGGGIGWGAVRGWLQARKAAQGQPTASSSQSNAPFQVLMAEGWQRFSGPVLLQLSGRDHTAREFEEAGAIFPAWKDWQQRPQLSLQRFPEADHTFSQRELLQASIQGLLDWLETKGSA